VDHYNEARPHRAIDLQTPVPFQPASDTVAAIERVDRLGGLIHKYRRAA
jgi:putative transposase